MDSGDFKMIRLFWIYLLYNESSSEERVLVIVKYYGMIRLITQSKAEAFEVSAGTTLHSLLLEVAKRYPGLDKQLLDQAGNLFSDIPIFLNGRNPRLLSTGLNTPLKKTDVISLFSPVASGNINVEHTRRILRGFEKGTR